MLVPNLRRRIPAPGSLPIIEPDIPTKRVEMVGRVEIVADREPHVVRVRAWLQPEGRLLAQVTTPLIPLMDPMVDVVNDEDVQIVVNACGKVASTYHRRDILLMAMVEAGIVLSRHVTAYEA